MRLLIHLLCFAVAVPFISADPPATPVIRLPELVAPPAPMPGPDAVAKLTADTLYVVDGDTDYLLLASPRGLVTTTTEAGPVKVRGRFADGNGKIETRVYKGKQVTFVEAAHSGRVELLIVPKGAATEADVIRRTVDVEAGEGPIPPPVPPGPGPKPPEPVSPSPFKEPGLRVLMVYETGVTLPAGQGPILFGKSVREYLDSKTPLGPDGKTHEWRIYDQNIDASAEAATWKDAMARPRKSVPWILVGNGKAGFEGPLPATVEETLALIKKYAE